MPQFVSDKMIAKFLEVDVIVIRKAANEQKLRHFRRNGILHVNFDQAKAFIEKKQEEDAEYELATA